MTSVDIQALERTSDDVDKLNIIRAEMKKPGAGKDKAEFRRYDGAKDHVRLFYTEYESALFLFSMCRSCMLTL